MWSEKNPGKYTHWKIKKIKMQSHCVCSCLYAMKRLFLASASEYSQWKHYYKRQQVVSAELIKRCDCSFKHGPMMWLTIPSEWILLPSSSLSNGRPIREDMKMLEILESNEGVRMGGEDWLQGNIFSLPFISPLSYDTNAAARAAKHGVPPRLHSKRWFRISLRL